MTTMIETENLKYAYPADEEGNMVFALRGVDLTIEKGTFVVVLGHNGSGKSTLAKTFNGVLLPAGGRVYVEGMDTCDSNLLLAIRQRVGMVFQNPDNQIVANVVEEDVAFAPENLGVPSEEIQKRVDDALSAVGMSEFVRHAPHLLSGGQKQRIAIAGVHGHGAGVHRTGRGYRHAGPGGPAGGAGHHSPPEPGKGDHGGAHYPPHE